MRYRAALVTGASRGLGRALAVELAPRCSHIVLVARTASLLEEAASEVRRAGAEATIVVLDVADADGAAARIREIDRAIGGLDLVVANAGVGVPDARTTPWAWEAIREPLHVNLCGAAATLTAALPAMVARGRGHLVGISSLAAVGPLPEAAAYCTPKAGLEMLLGCLRLDLRRTGVAVTSVRLGFVRTRMVEHATHPMPQIMEPAECAALVARKLAKRPATITTPLALAAGARVYSVLPRALREAVTPLARSK